MVRLLIAALVARSALALPAPRTDVEREDHARRRRELSTPCKCHEVNCCTRSASCPSVRPASEVAAHFSLDMSFYKKFVEAAGGIPVVSSNLCPDEAVLQAAMIVNRMCRHRVELCRYVADNGVQLAVMAGVEQTTDVPEHAHLDAAFWDDRARGLGSTCTSRVTSCAEENVLCYADDPYDSNSILIHEFAHSIHERGIQALYPRLYQRIREAYMARDASLFGAGVYAATNEVEFFAELTQTFFSTQVASRPFGGSRAELKTLQPALYALLGEVWGQDDDYNADGVSATNDYNYCPAAKTAGGAIHVDCSDFWAGGIARDFAAHPWRADAPCVGSTWCASRDASDANCAVVDAATLVQSDAVQAAVAGPSGCGAFARGAAALATSSGGCARGVCSSAAQCLASASHLVGDASCVDVASAAPSCPGWAASGECANNPGYMGVNCKGSCSPQFCTAPTTARELAFVLSADAASANFCDWASGTGAAAIASDAVPCSAASGAGCVVYSTAAAGCPGIAFSRADPLLLWTQTAASAGGATVSTGASCAGGRVVEYGNLNYAMYGEEGAGGATATQHARFARCDLSSTSAPVAVPTNAPTSPTRAPTGPSPAPTSPTAAPTSSTQSPSPPTAAPSSPSQAPTETLAPSASPSKDPTQLQGATKAPTPPTASPAALPTLSPSSIPTSRATAAEASALDGSGDGALAGAVSTLALVLGIGGIALLLALVLVAAAVVLAVLATAGKRRAQRAREDDGAGIIRRDSLSLNPLSLRRGAGVEMEMVDVHSAAAPVRHSDGL